MLTAVAVETNKGDICFVYNLNQIRFDRERGRERERERERDRQRERERENTTFSKGTNTSRD